MKLKSISALLFYVKDLNKTAKFYENLGFYLEKHEDDFVMVRINWFTVEFYKGEPEPGKSQATLISVDDVDQMYKEVQAKGIETVGGPKAGLNGRRELIINDPDGYRLIFFQKK